MTWAMLAAVFLVALMIQGAGNRESRRPAPAAVPPWTPSFEAPDVTEYDLAAARIRPEILADIEASR